MKRAFVLILAILYIGTSTGATLHMHYCMGKLVDVKLWNDQVKKCSKCGNKQNKVCTRKCCRDEHKTIKLEKDQKLAENSVHAMQLVTGATIVSYINLPQVHPVSLVEEYSVGNAPPRSCKVHTHILNCTFRV